MCISYRIYLHPQTCKIIQCSEGGARIRRSWSLRIPPTVQLTPSSYRLGKTSNLAHDCFMKYGLYTIVQIGSIFTVMPKTGGMVW